MDPELGNEDLEDEAAVAVREAVSRAAAEAGVDVSRETELPATDVSLDELGEEPSIDRESAARSARVTFRIDRDALNGDRRVMAVANQKGGVGKSTTAVNIGAYLALAGARVLVVDLDPQGNASTGLGLDHREIEPSIYDVLTGEAAPAAAIRPTGVANLHVLPSTIDLAGAEVELVSAMSRETRLRRALESVDHQYDSILIDCPPSLGLLTVNALAAADELLIPIQCEYYALEGLGQLLRNVELVRANLNPDLRIGGIVLTMYDGRTRLALQVVDEVRKHFTDVVYQTVVPRSVRLSEAPGYGLPIALYDPLSRGGIAYRDLTLNSRSEVACSRRPEKEQVDATSWWPWPWTGRPDPEQPARRSRPGGAGRRPGTRRRAPAAESSGPSFEQLPLDRIDPNPRQPREAFDEEPLHDLTTSIEAVGVLQPIVVRPHGERYQIVMGSAGSAPPERPVWNASRPSFAPPRTTSCFAMRCSRTSIART